MLGFATGFFALMCLEEISFPDDKFLWDWRKLICRDSITVTEDSYGFHLPHHKADPYFKGNQVIVHKQQFQHDPLFHFKKYLASQDQLFPFQ